MSTLAKLQQIAQQYESATHDLYALIGELQAQELEPRLLRGLFTITQPKCDATAPPLIDNSKSIKNVLSDKEELMPKYQDGSFRTRKSGILEYRFRHEDKYCSVYGSSKQACWDKRTAVIQGKKKVNKTASADYTLAGWLYHWYNTFRRKKSGLKNQQQNINYIKLISERLGEIQLKKVTTERLQVFLESLDDNPAKRDKVAGLLRSALAKAQVLRYIKINPCEALEINKHKAKRYPVLTFAQQRLVYNSIDQPKYRVFFLLACGTGARITEMVNAIPYIDFATRTVHIVDEDTDTKKHQREIPFVAELITASDIALLEGIKAEAVQTYFKRLFKRLGINAVIHSFRVTFISCCHFVGIPDKQTQEWAGHSTIGMTMDGYAKPLKPDGTSPVLEYIKALKKQYLEE